MSERTNERSGARERSKRLGERSELRSELRSEWPTFCVDIIVIQPTVHSFLLAVHISYLALESLMLHSPSSPHIDFFYEFTALCLMLFWAADDVL